MHKYETDSYQVLQTLSTLCWLRYIFSFTNIEHSLFNKSWKQDPIKHQLYVHQQLISRIIQIKWTRHAGHCWRSKDELISDILLWTPSHGRASVGWPARTYLQQLCMDTGFSLKDLLEVMDNGNGWQERVREICVSGTTWWWYMYMCACNIIMCVCVFLYKKNRHSSLCQIFLTLTNNAMQTYKCCITFLSLPS